MGWQKKDLAKAAGFASPAKYHAQKSIVNGITFASKKEGERYRELFMQQAVGWISELTLQPKFVLQERFKDNNFRWQLPIWYVADFQYFDKQSEMVIVEDVKGFKTPVYRLKKKLFLMKFPHLKFVES